jgi:ribonuclease BN (tRNA processing enzyme)
MLISEATFTVAYEGRSQHLSGRQAGQFAREAGAKALMVTHNWSNLEKATILNEAAEAFGNEVIQARVGLGVSV